MSGDTDMKAQIASSMARGRDSGTSDLPSAKADQVWNTEKENGITEYLNQTGSFTGITKYRWSDFIVHEITTTGKVVTLTNSELPEGSELEQKMDKKEVVRPDWFPDSVWNDLAEISSSSESKGDINIPASTMSKEERTLYHRTIKASFPTLITNTAEVDGVKVISVKRGTRDARDRFDKRNKPWPKDRPSYLHFCMYKENLDTFAALNMISMDLKRKAGKFHVAGTKDARAKTAQMVSIKEVEAADIAKAASKFRAISVGDFSYEDARLKLGDLQGNQFDIVLRHVQGDDAVIAQRMKSFQENGFINYYGMQRFGVSSSSSTHKVGRAIIKKEWRSAVNMILSSGPMVDEQIAAARICWQRTQNPQKAYGILNGKQKRTTIEGNLLHSLCKIDSAKPAYKEALDRLPPNSRQLYVHGFQSYIWNRLVSRRLKEHGLEARVGDLVLCNQGDSKLMDACEDGGTASEQDDGMDAAQTASKPDWSSAPALLPDVKTLTSEDVGKYSIHDVVMPLPGWAVTLPTSEVGDWYRELLQESDVDLSRANCDTMRQYSLAGAYRHIMARPTHVQWRSVRYSNPAQDLIASEVDAKRGRPAPPGDDPTGLYRALVLQFRLPPSCYATMALRELTGTESTMAVQNELNQAYSEEIAKNRQAKKQGELSVKKTEEKEEKSNLADVDDGGDREERSTNEIGKTATAEKRDREDTEEPVVKKPKTESEGN